MKAKTAVLGVGNPIMTDEGIGVLLVQRLEEHASAFPMVDFREVGTGGMKLLHILADYRKVVFIDCAYMQTEPGTLKRFTLDEVLSVKELPNFSLHEGDLLQILRKARELELCPADVVIFGIEPERMEPGQCLTETLQSRLENYIQTILQELQSAGNE